MVELMAAPTRASRVALLAAVVGVIVASRAGGWPAPALVGAALAAASTGRNHRGTPARDAALATVLGWGAILAWATLRGGAQIAGLVGGLAGAPARGAEIAVILAVLTLAVGAALAWSAATVVAGLLRLAPARRRGASAPGRATLSATPAPPSTATPTP